MFKTYINKKRLGFILIIAIMLFSALTVTASANNNVDVMLDGNMLEFDVQPQIINGRTMVPMRKIFESLGASVEWDGNTRTVTAKRAETIVVMQIDNPVMQVNANSLTLDVPPQLVDGRTLVPVRAVAESFDIKVIWDSVTSTVLLTEYIPFDSPRQTFEYLCDWLIENGTPYASYTYIGWEVKEGVRVEIRCYPETSLGKRVIMLKLDSYDVDGIITSIGFYPTNDGTDVYVIYDSLGDNFHINGDINIKMHTPNYPLSCVECEYETPETEYGILESTRTRINYLLDESDILLSCYGTKVTLNTLGFKKH